MLKKNQGHISQKKLYYFKQSFWGISKSELISKAQHVWHHSVDFLSGFSMFSSACCYLMYSHKCLNSEAIPIVNLACQQDYSKVPPLMSDLFPARNWHFSCIVFWVTLPLPHCCSLGGSSDTGNLRSEQAVQKHIAVVLLLCSCTVLCAVPPWSWEQREHTGNGAELILCHWCLSQKQ